MSYYERKATELFASAGIQVDGPAPHDIQVNDRRFYRRFLSGGRTGIGESYMDGWWDCERLDEMFFKIFSAQKLIVSHIQTPETLAMIFLGKMLPHGSLLRSHEIGEHHYDIGNELYVRMLDPYMMYSCGVWEDDVQTLADAQQTKLKRLCEKLQLEAGMRVLDIGCGWGGFAKFAIENYGVTVEGISVSRAQIDYAKRFCAGLAAEFRYQDYRHLQGEYDRIISIGMFEHVGKRYFRTYMEKVHACLSEDGLFVLHTIGFDTSDFKNPWLQKYIFPGCYVPSLKHIGDAYEGLFVLEHVENIGHNYNNTLLHWFENFVDGWPDIRNHSPEKYDDRFYRMWKYYLLSNAPGFRARKIQVWQFVFSRSGVKGGYRLPKAGSSP